MSARDTTFYDNMTMEAPIMTGAPHTEEQLKQMQEEDKKLKELLNQYAEKQAKNTSSTTEYKS
jgi:hypothetical protein